MFTRREDRILSFSHFQLKEATSTQRLLNVTEVCLVMLTTGLKLYRPFKTSQTAIVL